MATQESPQRLRFLRSRVIKFSFITVLILAGLYLFSTIMIVILTIVAEIKEASPEMLSYLEKVVDFIHIDVAGAIGTIVTATVARYALRETSANIKGQTYNSETNTEENNSVGC